MKITSSRAVIKVHSTLWVFNDNELITRVLHVLRFVIGCGLKVTNVPLQDDPCHIEDRTLVIVCHAT